MPEKLLVPSIEHRLAAFLEVNRQRLSMVDPFHKPAPVVTISREFGCEAFPVAERLRALLEEKTGASWSLMERQLLERLAREEGAAPSLFERLGERNSFFDDLFSVLSAHWRSHKDYYQVLCRQIFALASHGRMIFVGRGCPVLLGKRENTFHFRLVAPMAFKVASIARRLGTDEEAAERVVRQKQEQRDAFARDFLNADLGDDTLYHLVFNNARNQTERIAEIIAGYVPKG